jgi:hypothetical protein
MNETTSCQKIWHITPAEYHANLDRLVATATDLAARAADRWYSCHGGQGPASQQLLDRWIAFHVKRQLADEVRTARQRIDANEGHVGVWKFSVAMFNCGFKAAEEAQ